MEDTGMDIMVAVEAIFQLVHEEFSAAASASSTTGGAGSGGGGGSGSSSSSSSFTTSKEGGMGGSNKWIGLDADSKHRIDVLARTEVNTLRSILAKESAKLDETPGLRLRKEELDELFAKQAREREYYTQLLAILPENPKSVTDISGEAEKYEDVAEAIGWPKQPQQSTTTTTIEQSSTASAENAHMQA